VKRAGLILKNEYGKTQSITYKGAINLVTEMDHRAEAAVIKILEKEFPSHSILTEESNGREGSSSYRWILDPLDGTTNYAHGYPFFCVSLALEKDGQIVWGIIYDPLREELFAAEAGRGASVNGRALQVSATRLMQQSFLCTGFPYDMRESTEDNLRYFSRFAKIAQAIRRDGSAALDLCYVAMGRFDGFWEMKLNPWDVAAGGLIVTEAGGRVTNFSGGHFTINGQEILATNGLIHEDMLSVLSKQRE
jgi:myo-inositol-1(or 4)-monophosphatase